MAGDVKEPMNAFSSPNQSLNFFTPTRRPLLAPAAVKLHHSSPLSPTSACHSGHVGLPQLLLHWRSIFQPCSLGTFKIHHFSPLSPTSACHGNHIGLSQLLQLSSHAVWQNSLSTEDSMYCCAGLAKNSRVGLCFRIWCSHSWMVEVKRDSSDSVNLLIGMLGGWKQLNIVYTRISNPWEKFQTQICTLYEYIYLHLCTGTKIVSWHFLFTNHIIYDCVYVAASIYGSC